MTEFQLVHKEFSWRWSDYHKWSERAHWKVREYGLLDQNSRVFGMGSCFADHVVRFLGREVGIESSSFRETRFYDPASILQAIRHLLVEPQYSTADLFRTDQGQWAHPFRNPRYRADSCDALMEWSDGIESDARARLQKADLVILALGGIETWRHPESKKTYITIPFPDVFNDQMPGIAEFHMMTYQEVLASLEESVGILMRELPQATIVITISPIRMAFTTSPQDVTIATSHGKSVLRAAVGELVGKFGDRLHYFHSYEIVQYAPPGLNLYGPDNSHVNDLAVSMVMHEFCRCYLAPEVRLKTAYAITSMMVQSATDQSRIAQVQKIDLRLLGIRWARTLGMERVARWLYAHLKR